MDDHDRHEDVRLHRGETRLSGPDSIEIEDREAICGRIKEIAYTAKFQPHGQSSRGCRLWRPLRLIDRHKIWQLLYLSLPH